MADDQRAAYRMSLCRTQMTLFYNWTLEERTARYSALSSLSSGLLLPYPAAHFRPSSGALCAQRDTVLISSNFPATHKYLPSRATPLSSKIYEAQSLLHEHFYQRYAPGCLPHKTNFHALRPTSTNDNGDFEHGPQPPYPRILHAIVMQQRCAKVMGCRSARPLRLQDVMDCILIWTARVLVHICTISLYTY
ncbi:hypothetical protein BC834DRAFT_339170 [Gloeopeniophorella convolvens]|nr:hypothetical protein BC834DRAFT_339170 [Gloeopeniophorella convolvens]